MLSPELGMIEPSLGFGMTALPAPSTGRTSIADALFTGTQQRVLALLFGQPRNSFYANEVIARVRSGSGAVQRELARLVQSELVTVQLHGRQKHYQANAHSPIFAELCSLVQKTMGLADPLRDALAPLAHRIQGAFVYGSVAKRQDTASSDIDLMILSSDVDYADVFGTLEALTQRLGRTVNPTIYSPRELAQRIERGDAFIKRVLEQDKIWLIGDDRAFSV
jgi:predicted nucleotidyltransferase